ncbi:MAG: ABC transporter ATP-binding protein [Bacillus sp. (in: firmicutes)]
MDIQVKNLTKEFLGKAVVQDVSFSIAENRCVALIGPNGAGKTTLLRMLAGLLTQEKGDISFHHLSQWKKDIGFLPQNPTFYNWMTPTELLGMLGKLSGMKGKELNIRIKEVLQATGIETSAHRKIGGFSGGMKQRLGLAQALLHKPSLLLLDEPVSALDPVGRRDVMNILSTLKETTTIIYSTHVLHDAEEISDDVLLMKDGQIVASDTLANLLFHTSKKYLLKSANPIEQLLSSCSLVSHVQMLGNQTAELLLLPDITKEQFLQWCLNEKVDILSFQQGKQTLESVFMEVVK